MMQAVSIESEYFKRRRPDFQTLEQFGFQRRDGGFYYAELLPGETFRAELEITENGMIRGRVIDLDTGEEYLPLRLVNQVGGFVGTIREKYLAFLMRIDEACFTPVHFIGDQAGRVEGLIYNSFGAAPVFPWEKYPGNGVFRREGNQKWFAAILTVAFGKLQGADAPADDSLHDPEEIVEVINLKARPEEIGRLTEEAGIYAAWHMNKKHWISVILDETVPDARVMELVRESYRLVGEGGGARTPGTGAWMIPSNPALYDVDAGFRRGGGEIEWHQHNRVNAGDEVFIYCSAPYSALIYRCEVVAADLPYHGMFQESRGYTKSMRIRLVEKYPPDRYPLAFIKEHGGSVVRSARSMPEQLYRAIESSSARGI